MKDSRLPPLNWLHAFEAAARQLSFTGAAGELNMTQSAVSQQIKALEQRLGHPLFIRRPRALLLTEAGERYLPVVQDAFDRLQRGTRALTGEGEDERLTIQCNMAFSIFWLAPRLPGLLKRFPWLSINVVPEIWINQTEPTASMLIRYGHKIEEGLESQLLSRGEFYPVCAPELLARADWRHDPLFDCSAVFCCWENWLADQGQSLPAGRSINLASTYSITLTAALHGAGLAMGHDALVGDLLQSGRLARPFDHAVQMREAYYLIQPARHSQTRASQAFVSWIEEEFGL
ncbi:LysR family transcriptional regulator [Kiloniella laminariae]|uniref:LysR family transcriptional regulator n=1 Tax=Kiloniella laminariae TaxID=454162 RepID=UPI000380F219|nr:LysR family transcriptional regulator [Kiloniella laminariae]